MKRFCVFLCCLFFFFGCYKEEGNCDCVNLADALISEDYSALQEIINGFTFDLSPQNTESDKLGHKKNLEILVYRMNQVCQDFKAEIKCYGCIYTLPVQSEIIIKRKKDGLTKIIDLLTFADYKLVFNGVHE